MVNLFQKIINYIETMSEESKKNRLVEKYLLEISSFIELFRYNRD